MKVNIFGQLWNHKHLEQYRMKKTILIKFSNGDWFEADLLEIAKHRADYYSSIEEFNHDSKKYQEEVDVVMKYHEEGLDWVQNNMEWNEVKHMGDFVNRDIYDHEDEFYNATLEVLVKKV
jgi:hypothetical protein